VINLGFVHVSTGDHCRLEKERETVIGKTIAVYDTQGDLVPDSIMKTLFGQILEENKITEGVISDGYPRTIPQVNDLLALCDEMELSITNVINIEAPKSELLHRAEQRAIYSNRADDKDPKIHLKRIDVFEEATRPAIEYMATKMEVTAFDGLGSIESITEKIKNYKCYFKQLH